MQSIFNIIRIMKNIRFHNENLNVKNYNFFKDFLKKIPSFPQKSKKKINQEDDSDYEDFLENFGNLSLVESGDDNDEDFLVKTKKKTKKK